jgi:hypothetical protein
MDKRRINNDILVEEGKPADRAETKSLESPSKPQEIGGPQGPEPTRYGDWERRGRCIDF